MFQRLLGRLRGISRLFLLVVVLPTVLSSAYFGLYASDVFISESRFVVRSPQRQAATGLGAILQSAGFSRSQDDTYTVHDYILSRDALRQLEDQLALQRAFGSREVDVFARFAGIDPDDSFEALHRYYQGKVRLEFDSASSIMVLKTSAFDAGLARDMNVRLLELSERLVNTLNQRGREDMIRFAAAEVAAAEDAARQATLAMASFRSRMGVFDPDRQSALQLQLVSKLQDELIATRTQIAQVRLLASESPQIPALEKRLETLRKEIETETSKVAGAGRSLSSQSVEFERLSLDRSFADKQLAAALTSLEQARNDAQRKQFYLERIVQPVLADRAVEPRRFRSVMATFVLGLAAWGILSMLLAGVREHQD